MTWIRPVRDTGQRVIAWFSCGDASAVAAKLALQWYGQDRVDIVRIRLGGEHEDNDRFAADCERWFDQPVREIGAARYTSHWDVIEGERFINGPSGAKCTALLKRRVREDYQQFDDIQVFGFTDEEWSRFAEFRAHHNDLMLVVPLLVEGLSKNDCHALIAQAGIELPAMYKLGYPNNNCIGCVKGGMGYWNKIRVDFPDVFVRMAVLERQLGRSCLKESGRGGKRVFLDELDPARGRLADEPKLECGITCFSAARKLAA